MDAPGEKLVLRLWETVVEKGIGGLLSPWQKRRTERARIAAQREERLALAQAERDIEQIQSGRKRFTADYQLVEGRPEDETVGQDAASRALASTAGRNLLLKQMRAEVNVAKALLHAETELEGDAQEPPERKIDDDWLIRWRDSASNVSAEKLQTLWGRVLAGEVKSPGSFSLRMLEFLKNLSQEEARRIEQLAPFVIDNSFVFSGNQQLLESEGVPFGRLVELQDLGIITQANAGMSVTLRIHASGRRSPVVQPPAGCHTSDRSGGSRVGGPSTDVARESGDQTRFVYCPRSPFPKCRRGDQAEGVQGRPRTLLAQDGLHCALL